MDCLLIAISGKLGSGKDYLMEHYFLPRVDPDAGVTKMAFADQLKINVASKTGASLADCLSGNKSAELRRELQLEGTERGRDLYGPDIWVTALENWVRLRKIRGDQFKIVLITDCRFPNEAQWVEDNGGFLLRIEAPDRTRTRLEAESKGDPKLAASIGSHLSETALDNYSFRYKVDNSSERDTVRQEAMACLDKYLCEHPEFKDLFTPV